MQRRASVGYVLTVFLGALGAHLFYYRRYIRGTIYVLICFIIQPLIPVMIFVGWVDLFFIARWTREINKTPKEFHVPQATPGNNKIPNKNAKHRSITTNKSRGNQSFYSENENIIDKYSNIKTPKYILDGIDSKKKHNKPSRYDEIGITVSINTGDSEFYDDSIRYRDHYIETAREIPLMAYWTTFQSLSKEQLKWYLHWRREVLNQRYIDVDMSYIILFVYELINYSFNQNAAFNISVVVNLYKNYKEREPKLKNYLPQWTADMLYELGEVELAQEWDQQDEGVVPKLYAALEEDIPLNKISMTTWRKYLKNHRQTAYFTENRTKIYNVFKNGLTTLESEKKELIEKWFKVVDSRKIRYLFQAAVMFRNVEPIHVPTTNTLSTDASNETITAMLKLSENISRKVNGVRHQLKVNENALPIGFKDYLEDRYLDKASTERDTVKKSVDTSQSNDKSRVDERFSVVSEEDTSKGSDIPVQPKKQSGETEVVAAGYKFDDSLIKDISKRMDEVVGLFDDESSERINTENESGNRGTDEPNLKKPVVINPLNSIQLGGDKVDIDSFVESLNEYEVKFILRFRDSTIMDESKAQQILREQGVMLSVFLTNINEKSNMHLGEILFDTGDGVVEYDKEFDDIFTCLEELELHGN